MMYMKLQKYYLSLIVSLVIIQSAFSQTDYESAYYELRKTIYNSFTANETSVNDKYNYVLSLINSDSSLNKLIEKSKCDYLMGLFYMDIENNSKAIDYFQNSMNLAESDYQVNETAQGYLAYAESLAQICRLMPTSYLIANGLKVGTIAKKALKLDNRLGAARYLVCSIIAYGPVPFRNFSKAEKLYLEILENDNLDEEDCFNVYISLGYIQYQKKEFTEADKWFDLAAKIYPYNKFLQSLQTRKYKKNDYITVNVEQIIDCMMED